MERKLCAIKKCVNSKKITSKGVRFFRIPLDGEKRQKWLEFIHEIQGSHNVSELTQLITLCSIHFGKNAFTKGGNLMSNSFPTISTNSTDSTKQSNNDEMADCSYTKDINDTIIESSPATNANSTGSTECADIGGKADISCPKDFRDEKNALLRRINGLEIQLYKEHDKNQVHRKRLIEKNIQISSLLKQNKYLYEQKVKREREDETGRQRMGLSNDAIEVLDCLRFGNKDKSYRESIRKFAITLHFYSPRAYDFIRNKFKKHLPDPSCIRSWYRNCNDHCESGISSEAIRTLRTLASEFKSNGKLLLCSLSFDEINIKRHVQWCDSAKQFLGPITYGKSDENGEIPVARNVLVFMITTMNSKLSIPIAYYFIKMLDSVEKSILIRNMLSILTNFGIKVITITFDGLSSNIKSCELLGASISSENMRLYIENPIDNSKIFILLDACHMIKLLRNYIGKENVLTVSPNEKIEWKFFELLEKFRIKQNLVTHKLTKKHIQWQKAKMNVGLAVQLFSNSVADSMLLLKKRNYKEFSDCEPTVRFIRVVNNLFDVLNSKYVNHEKGFKSAINPANADMVFEFFKETLQYFGTIKISNQNVLKFKRRMGFKGLQINMLNVQEIYKTYVETGILEYLPTFYLSQDLLESMFSRIRSLNGNNDNPTVSQFISAFRKILVNSEITSSHFANCTDQLSMLSISSRRRKETSDDDIIRSLKALNLGMNQVREDVNVEINTNDYLFDGCEDLTISRIAGAIEKKIRDTRYDCENCKTVVNENEKVAEFDIMDENVVRPCISTMYICETAFSCLKQYKDNIQFKYDALVENIKDLIDFSNVYPTSAFQCDPNHKVFFVEFIIAEFIRIQATYIAKNMTLVEQKVLLRHRLRKQIHHLGL